MKTSCTLQIHIDGAWRDTGALSLIGPVEQGMATPLAGLLAHARALGIEEPFLAPLAPTVAQVCSQLEAL